MRHVTRLTRRGADVTVGHHSCGSAKQLREHVSSATLQPHHGTTTNHVAVHALPSGRYLRRIDTDRLFHEFFTPSRLDAKTAPYLHLPTHLGQLAKLDWQGQVVCGIAHDHLGFWDLVSDPRTGDSTQSISSATR
jgi:hypothetical protein